MRRFLFPYIILSLAVTFTLAGLFYLPYMSVRNKTIDSFQARQMLLLNKVAEGIEGYFATYRRALAYLAEQQTILDMDNGGRMLLEDFHAMHRSWILGIVRTGVNGEVLFSVNLNNIRTDDYSNQPAEKVPVGSSNVQGEDLFPGESGELLFTAKLFREGAFDGNISFTISSRDIARTFIKPVLDERRSRILLFDQGGNILYPSGKESGIAFSNEDEHGELIRLYRAAIEKKRNGRFILETSLFEDRSGSLSSGYGACLPVELPGGISWSLMIVSPEVEVLGTMTAFRKLWLSVTLVTVFAVMLLFMGLMVIQGKRRDERTHRRFEEQMVQMLDYAPMGVLLITEKGIISYANRAAAEIVVAKSGRSLDGKRLLDFIHPEDQPQFEDYLETCAREVAGERFSVKVAAKNQVLRDGVISAVRMQIGSSPHYIIILQDVTDALKIEEVQRRLATAVDQVKELVIITDTMGLIVYINPAYCEISGYRRVESLGHGLQMLWAKENEPGLWSQIREALDGGNVWKGRIVNQRKNGTTFVSSTTVSPVRNSNGFITHYVMLQRDVTHEVAFEARVQQARKMEAIGTLAGGIAHDFNNILGGIIGFTDMALLHCERGTEIHDSLLHIRQGGKRAADLVQQILTFSRQSGLEKSPVSVAPLVKESLHLIRASLPSTIAIDQRILDPDCKVTAAPVQIQQIIMNLCTNAFYSMRDKGGTLTITLERFTAEQCSEFTFQCDEGCVCLIVRDTGVGMEDALLQRIFTPFFTTKAPGEGTGMGLSVVQGIVQDIGGEIQVKSVLGKGTSFLVYLPLAKEGHEGTLLSGEKPLPTGDEHIVVVDDEKEIRETCSMMLRHFGYRVSAVSEPEDVLAMVEESEEYIDLVITDHTMPGMTGLELTKALRMIRPELPVILCTGYSDKLNYHVAIESGACDFMMKPVDLQELAITVRAALDGDSPSENNGRQ